MKTTPVSILLAGILLPTLGMAQAPDVDKHRKFGRKAFFEAWKAADLNKDGFISKPEYEALPRLQNLPAEKRAGLFTRLDKDADGQLSAQELSQFKNHGEPGDKPMKRLWELDADKSGGISFEEYQQGQFIAKLPLDKQEALFKRLDTDGDAAITPKDRPEPSPRSRPGGQNPPAATAEQIVHKLDTDQDGSLSFAEFRLSFSMRNLTEDEQEKRFDKIDSNKDLKISTEELTAAHKRPEPAPKP
jgi:Ca2+-binding EF-hand superfamily protein